MFSKIFNYELAYWLKRPAPYLYAVAFFSIAFLSFAGTAGFFDPPTTSTRLQRWINSPKELNYILLYFNKFFLFLLPAIIGATVYKDFKHQVHSILYSFPIQKRDYLLGKFFSSFLVVVLICVFVGIGFLIAEHLPNLHQNKLGPFQSIGYIQAYLIFLLPNLLIHGTIVFVAVVWTRNIYAGFVSVILLFFLQIITENAFANQDFLIALFDPFGQNTVAYVTQLWTLEEQNTLVIPIVGAILYNRLLWLGIAAALFALTYQKFRFNQHPMATFGFKIFKRKDDSRKANQQVGLEIPSASFSFSVKQQVLNSWRLSQHHLKYIVKSPMFLLIVLMGIAALVFALAKVTNAADMAFLPVTRLVLTIPAFFFTSIIILLTFVYTGMLVHRERMAGMDQLVDTSPVPNGTLLLAKLWAILQMQALLLFLMMFAGIALQIFNGYYQFEIGLYLFELYILKFLSLAIWAFAAMLVHSLFPNVYLGIFVLVFGWMGVGSLSQVGINTYILQFNSPPQLLYSDMNGYAQGLKGYFLVEGYWFAFGFLLLVMAYLLWFRGLPHSFQERMSLAKARFTGFIPIASGMALISFILLGVSIFQEENKTADRLGLTPNQALQQFKENYQNYAGFTQPRITSMKVALDLFPQKNSFEAQGTYTLVNQSSKPIDTLLIKSGFDEETELSFDRETEVLSQDDYFHFSVVKLKKSLLPKDSMQLDFIVKNIPNTLFDRSSSVLNNGTFLLVDIFPRLGYFIDRAKIHPADSIAGINNYQSIDSDRLRFETTISTSEDQWAIAPGYLSKKWEAGNRNYFHYKMDQPSKYSFVFNSAKFEVKKETWKGINLEIYYQKGHEHNLNKMMKGLRASLDYNSKHFGPYQHREARIIEFPHSEGSYATTSANSIPMSEVRFIANTDTSADKMDISFYVPAHELAHQWWGNQLTPSASLGALMLSESITEYVSLNIYEETYGKEMGLNFLNMQRNRYLKGRTRDSEKEVPLYLVDKEQQYIAYGKGSMVFNAMGHYLGKEKLNRILREFLEVYKFAGPPYPTTLNFINRLRAGTPDSLQYLITDMYETITFYDNTLNRATLTPLDDGNFQVDIDFSVNKNRAEAEQSEKSLPLADFLEIGVYDEENKLISLSRHKITQTKNELRLILSQKPSKVMLDPHLLMIDKNVDDNEKTVNGIR